MSVTVEQDAFTGKASCDLCGDLISVVTGTKENGTAVAAVEGAKKNGALHMRRPGYHSFWFLLCATCARGVTWNFHEREANEERSQCGSR